VAKGKFFGIDSTINLGEGIVLRCPPLANSVILVGPSRLNAVVFHFTSMSRLVVLALPLLRQQVVSVGVLLFDVF
jgi:hypothetical protein